MIITIDIGNTNITIGLFAPGSDKVVQYSSWKTDPLLTTDDLAMKLTAVLGLWKVESSQLTGVVISSVVPDLDYPFFHLFEKYFGLTARFVQRDTVPIQIDYQFPEEIGADRIANVYAGLKIIPGENLIIVDFGTATTFDVVSRDAVYYGGIIIPGIITSLRSLTEKAAKLPPVDLSGPIPLIGKNTVDGIRSGILQGNGAMLDELVRRIATEMEWDSYRVAATGGLSELIQETSRSIHVIDKHLTLKGLFYIWNLLHAADK